MAQSSAAASHHKRKRARHQSSGAGGSMRSTVKDSMPTVEMREALNRDGEMGRVLLERGYLGAKLYTGPDITTGLLPGQHDQILAEMKWVHADVVGLRDLKQAQCRRVASAVKDYWRVRTKQQERGGGEHVRLDRMPDGTEVRHQVQASASAAASKGKGSSPSPTDDDDDDDIVMIHHDDTVSTDEESQFSNAAEARASIDPLRDIIDRLNDASAVWMSDKGPPIQSTTSSNSSSSSAAIAGHGAGPRSATAAPSVNPDDDAAVCSTVFVPGVVDFPDPGAEPRLRMNELLSNQRTLLHEMQFSEAARARLPALFTSMVREMSAHPAGDQESVVKTPRSSTSAVAKAKAPARSRKAAAAAAAQQQAMITVTQAWEEKENLLLLAALARSLPRCFDQKSSSTYFMVERRREALRNSVAANLQEDSLDLASGLLNGVSWRSVEIGMRCAMEGIAGQDKLRSNLACARRANEMLTERPMVPPVGTRWRGSIEGMAGEKQRQIGLPVEVRIVDETAKDDTSGSTPTSTTIEQTLAVVDDGALEKSVGSQEDALALFHYRRGLTTPTFAAFYSSKGGPSAPPHRRRKKLGDLVSGNNSGALRWRLPPVRKCIRKGSSTGALSSSLNRSKRRPCSTAIRSTVSRLATPVSFSEALKSWDDYIATVSHQNSCRWLSTAVTSMGAARRRRATECGEMRVFQWVAPPAGSPASPLALRNAHANALLALQRYASASMKGAPANQPASCIGPEALKLLAYAAHKMKEQMPDNGSGIEIAPTKQPIPENFRRTKVTMLPMATGRAGGTHMMGHKAPPHQLGTAAAAAALKQQQQAGGMVMGKAHLGGAAYQRASAVAANQQQQQQQPQPQHLAQLLQIRNAAAAAASAVNQHGGGGGSGGQQAPMQQYIMAKRGQMQPTSSTTTIGLQKQQQQQQKTALGKAPPSGGQRGQGSLGSAAGTGMPKVPSAAMHNLLQSMLNQQQAQQRAGATAAASNPQTAPAGPTQANNPAAAAAAAAMGRANLGNLHQLYQSLLTQFTHGSTTGMRRQGGLTPTGPSPSPPPPPPPTASGGAGVASGTNAMPAIQNMLQNILANSRPQYSAAPTPKGPGLRAPQGSPTATTPSLQQQRSPYQQFYAVGGSTAAALPKAVSSGSKAPAPAAATARSAAAAHGHPNAPSGPGV
ncbi:hypothetical protein FOZ61_008787 [Perkinsus olseni]|uniref:HSA domain-containing protein n=1 Tax=Perkinsus olseni TaxID=32597 RepID=A0A7J6MIE4_PEROL|nr:hypothetical protein FOZ61_008787 [Perkinsus olseni]